MYQTFYYSISIWRSTCFWRHTAHHQEPKLHWQSLGFHTWKAVGRVVGGHCQAQCAWQRSPSTRPKTFHVWKTRGCQCSFRLLMMGGVSSETCWASYKCGIIKFWYTVASCLDFSLWIVLWCTDPRTSTQTQFLCESLGFRVSQRVTHIVTTEL